MDEKAPNQLNQQLVRTHDQRLAGATTARPQLLHPVDELSEFVRRIYQAGGGGDLPGGGGTGGRPRTPGSEPEGGGPDMGGTELDLFEGGGTRSIIDAAIRARGIASSELRFIPGDPIESELTEFTLTWRTIPHYAGTARRAAC